MKFFTAITLAASASAATLERKQEPSKAISEFKAACIPHSVRCQYSFTISSGGLPGTTCSAEALGGGSLPAIGDGKCEGNSVYTWGIVSTMGDGGMRFGVTYPLNSRSNITYCHQLPASDFVVDDNGSVQTQRYAGPTDFEIKWADC